MPRLYMLFSIDKKDEFNLKWNLTEASVNDLSMLIMQLELAKEQLIKSVKEIIKKEGWWMNETKED